MKPLPDRICPFTNQACKDCSALFVDTSDGNEQYVSGCRIVTDSEEPTTKDL